MTSPNVGSTAVALAIAVTMTQASPVAAKANTLQPNLELYRKKYCSTLQFNSAVCESKRLRLQQTIPVDAQLPEDKLFELSGLALVSVKLFAVNDKNDPNEIFA